MDKNASCLGGDLDLKKQHSTLGTWRNESTG